MPSRIQYGPYRVIDLLGAGGMGEVFRAQDTRLGREVALKLLPDKLADHPEYQARFEREARLLGSLTHPNIMVIHDVGFEEGASWLVMELLEGETLAQRLENGPLSPRQAIEIGIQIARGLQAAHERGILHRDLKPSNVFITRGGLVKLLDFGLARTFSLNEDEATGSMSGSGDLADTHPQPGDLRTQTGVVMGTVSYMSPEQIRGKRVDHRSDIFSMGIVLYEMLTGKKPFQGDSAVETMNAILKEDPSEIHISKAHVSPALTQVLYHCLEKQPERRYQTAQDLAFHLESAQNLSGSGPSPSKPSRISHRWLPGLTLSLVFLGLLGGAYALGSRKKLATVPIFQRQTFRIGAVHNARFTDGGRALVYNASWDGEPNQLFTQQLGSSESRSMGLPYTQILAVSPTSNLAITLKTGTILGWINIGTLAQMPLSGGAPRELIRGVYGADWSPDGLKLAVARWEGNTNRLEYPLGTVLTTTGGWFSHPRISPDGQSLAYIEHPIRGDDRGYFCIRNLSTSRIELQSRSWSSLQGLAWAPNGKMLLFTASDSGIERALWSCTLDGRTQMRLHIPGGLTLFDIAPDGRALVSHNQWRSGILAQGPKDSFLKDYSGLSWSRLAGLSPDGNVLVFDEQGISPGPDYDVYLRRMDGSPPVRLGSGANPALSLDGKYVLVTQGSVHERKLVLLPTGAELPKSLELPPFMGTVYSLAWLPDNKHFLLIGQLKDKVPGVFFQSLTDQEWRSFNLRDFLPTGERPHPSPDGQKLLGLSTDWKHAVFDLEKPDNAPLILPLEKGEQALQWDLDGKHLFVARIQEHIQLDRLELSTGKRSPFRKLTPTMGTRGWPRVFHMSQNGETLAAGFSLLDSSLYVLEGLDLKPKSTRPK